MSAPDRRRWRRSGGRARHGAGPSGGGGGGRTRWRCWLGLVDDRRRSDRAALRRGQLPHQRLQHRDPPLQPLRSGPRGSSGFRSSFRPRLCDHSAARPVSGTPSCPPARRSHPPCRTASRGRVAGRPPSQAAAPPREPGRRRSGRRPSSCPARAGSDCRDMSEVVAGNSSAVPIGTSGITSARSRWNRRQRVQRTARAISSEGSEPHRPSSRRCGRRSARAGRSASRRRGTPT